MADPNAALHAREWLEHQLEELGQIRNASRRDPKFKLWRQSTLTVIQRLWPGDARRVDRFRRIPFSPPMARPTDRQVREYYERGWGEAGVMLREYLVEIERPGAARESAGTWGEDAGPVATFDRGEEPVRSADAVAAAGEAEAPPIPVFPDEFGRAMEQLFTHSPVFRGRGRPAPEPQSAPDTPDAADAGDAGATPCADEPGTPAGGLCELAAELEAFGLGPLATATVREALLALARASRAGVVDWETVAEAMRLCTATPTLARRAMPLLLGLAERAA